MSASNGKPKADPFLPKIAIAATEVAKCEKIADTARDELRLAHAERSLLLRELGKCSAVTRGGETVALVHPVTSKRYNGSELHDLEERIAQAEAKYVQSGDALSAASSTLNNLQKARENWEAAVRHDAAQAAARADEDAKLTPRQRAIRDAKQLLDAEGIR